MKTKLKQIIFSLYKFISRLGIHILPVHYYSPIPDINKLKKTKNIWAKKSDLPGIEVDLDKFIDHINRFHKTGTSIHDDENGHYFTVDDNFRKKLKEMTK